MKIWTEPEMQALRQRYPVELTAELAAELGRPAKHVRCKAFSMGVKKHDAGDVPHCRNRKARDWTEREDARIREWWPVISRREQPGKNAEWLARELGVTLMQVRSRAAAQVQRALPWQELHDDAAPLAALALPLTGRLAVALRFFEPNRLRRDLDNLPKAALDALTHAGLWGDDSQIDCLMLARAGVSPERPRVVVRVWRYAPSELDLLMEAA